MTDSDNRLAVDVLTWKEARSLVKQSNPDLAEVIDELSPSDEYKLYKARYRWGEAILEKGRLNLPRVTRGVVPLDDPNLDSHYAKALSYTHAMPLGLVLDNALELFIELEGGQATPFQYMKAGTIFALWTALDTKSSADLGKVWTISAGARSFFLLPKFSDKTYFRKLQRAFALKGDPPVDLTDQYRVFYEIMAKQTLAPAWTVDVLFFSEDWLKEKKAAKWRLFREYLSGVALKKTSGLRNQVVFDYAYSCIINQKNLRQNPYFLDTISHIYQLALGNATGFRIATEVAPGPVDTLSKIFVDVYGLRYAPTFAYQDYLNVFSDAPDNPIYYSLAYPTLLEFYPRSKKTSSKLNDMENLMYILGKTQSEFINDSLGIKTTEMIQKIARTSFHGFHLEKSSDGSVLSTDSLPEMDANLNTVLDRFSGMPFSEASPLMRGAIRIAAKKSQE